MRKKRNTGNSRKAHEIKRFLASLQKYVDVCNPDMFGPDSADSEEADDLEKYFVEFPRYRNIYSRSTKFLVARAKKGIGKSALLTHLSVTKKKGKNSIVVFTTGAHLYEFGNPTAATENEATNKWYNIIAQAVCGKLCDYIETPKTKSEFAIVRRCGSFGGKSSIISNLISGLKLKMPFVGFNDFSNITFYRILSEYLNENPTQQVWFIVDDIDSTFKNDEHNVSTVSSFFNAVRTISNDFKNLHIRACVRKDVWTSIRRERESLDKCEDHMLDMEWSASGIRSIIANRIRSFIKLQALNELDHLDHKFLDDIDDSKIISLIFPGTFKWTNSDKFPVYRYIHVLSGGRPRWALQLCKMASAEAGKSQKVVNKLNQNIPNTECGIYISNISINVIILNILSQHLIIRNLLTQPQK